MAITKEKKILAPQQEKFLALYTDPRSATFGNAYQSAIQAGYKKNYAESITTKKLDWLAENVGDLQLLHKAEKKLNEVLGYPAVDEAGRMDNQLLRTQVDVSKHVTETLGKHKYSKKVLVAATGDFSQDDLTDYK